MKHKNIFNFLLAVIFFISWSDLALAQNRSAAAAKPIEKCDIQKIIDSTEVIKKEHSLKLQSFDPNSKTVKNKIITDGVSTNIFLVKLFAAQESCKKSSDDDKKWINSEIEKNTKQLKVFTNSYCNSVMMPGSSTSAKGDAETGELGAEKNGCKNNAERRMVNFVFNVCTPGSADYDLKLCECHVQDRGNACLYEKDAAQKLIKKIEAVTEDNICDEKTPQSKSSFFDNQNFIDVLKVGAAALVAFLIVKAGLKYFKAKDKKNAETLAANGGGPTTGAITTGGLSKNFKGKFSGSVDMPNHEERIAGRNKALIHNGKTITGNDDIDNATLGGGTPDGGIYMAGSFEFTVDANNVITSGTYIIHGYPLKLGGGKINSDGSFTINPEGLEVSGKVDGSGRISGMVNEYAMDWVRGYMNGTFTPSK